ncbi:polysaccharide biosynthesis tyrosine autokinase [bacterium]|nr:polysaccharide biosynthesis tyrosine autokinase [bacterium]
MPYDQNDIGYDEVISRETSVTPRSLFLPLLLSILKRPWLSIGSIFLVMIPVVFFLYSQVPRFRSTAIVSIASNNNKSIISSDQMIAFSEGADEFYFYILDSYAFRNAILKSVLQTYPHLPADSVSLIIRRDITRSQRSRASSFMYIKTESESPEFAQFLAEQAIINFQQLSVSLRRSDAKLVADFINSQLFTLNEKLRQKESELQDFLSERQLLLDDISSGASSELRNLERNASEAKAQRDLARMHIDKYNEQIEERLNQYFNKENGQKSSKINLLRTRLEQLNDQLNSTIDNISTQKSDSSALHELKVERKQILTELIAVMHPHSASSQDASIDNRISIDKLERQLETALIDFEQAKIQLDYYNNAIKSYLHDHPNLPQDILEYMNIFREKSVLLKKIDILIDKNETIQIEMAAESGGVKIIDEPRVPDLPIPQHRGRKLAAVFILAILIGFGMAYIVDIFDNTVQGEVDIISKFNLPVFGSVPVLNLRSYRIRRQGTMPLLSEGGNGQTEVTLLSYHSESSSVAEAYRSIRTAILFSARERQQKSFVISSAVAGEGKSLTTFNLGVSFAQGGTRTLVVDADLRRSSLHKLTGLDRSPGLTDYLYGNVNLDEILLPCSVENLTLIPAGIKATNPADLLASHKMRQFLDEISPLYDIILFDTPPVTPCMDSRNLANLVGGMIYIVRAEMTKLNILEHSFSLANRVSVDILGVIVNYASFRYGYGYYYLYHRYHSYGYYSGGYHYYYYSYYQDSESSEKPEKKKKKVKSTESDTMA